MRRRGGFGLGFIFGAIAIFYGIQGLMAGAPLQTVIIQFILGAVMIGGGLYSMLRRTVSDGQGPVGRIEYISKECIRNNHAFCTDHECECRCGHKGIH